MPQVMMPQKKEDLLTSNLGTIGSLVGSAFAGPAGGAIGGAVGGQAGQTKEAPAAIESPGSGDTLSAAQRRMDAANASVDLKKGMEALKTADPQMQQEYGPILQEAMAKADAQRQQAIAARRSRLDGGLA